MTVKNKEQVIKAKKFTHSKKELGNLWKYTKYSRMKNKQKHLYSI